MHQHQHLWRVRGDCWIDIENFPDSSCQGAIRAQHQSRSDLFGAGIQHEPRATAAEWKSAAFMGRGNDPGRREHHLLTAYLYQLEERVRWVIHVSEHVVTDAHDDILSQSRSGVECKTFQPSHI